MAKRGTVWIAPDGWVPPGRMLDPRATEFWVSWQDGQLLEDDIIFGAEAAIRWGRDRSDMVLIRLGHSHGSYFSAGTKHPEAQPEEAQPWPPPPWPPDAPPPEGWWYPPPI